MKMQHLAKYIILPHTQHHASMRPFHLTITKGSIIQFQHEKGAIVNAANEGCLGGGGVDGAISLAGGDALLDDRRALPIVSNGSCRCPTGQAKITGPGQYGSLLVPYVIHAVGPSYFDYASYDEPDNLLRSAYRDSLYRAKEAKIEVLAYSLLSAGVFRGNRSLRSVLKIGMETICSFEGYQELNEVHLVAFNDSEADTLMSIAEEDMYLTRAN